MWIPFHWTLAVAALLSAGEEGLDASDANPAPARASVEVFGALKSIFHEGDISTKAELKNLLPNDRLYGVGALSDLRGEVTIVAGTAYIAYPTSSEGVRVEISEDSEERATLLVATEVTAWTTIVNEEEISFEELDEAIADLAKRSGLDVTSAFPFIIENGAADLEWHVIDGTKLEGSESSHVQHEQAGVRMRAESPQATLIGFFSADHQGIFTHMGSRTHIHCVIVEPLSSGHVDHVVLERGTVLRFPAPGQ